MQEINISEFKAKCLALLDEINKTKKPIRITRRGKPIAEVVPSGPAKGKSDWIGSMKGRMEIVGDIVSPIINLDEIEALKE